MTTPNTLEIIQPIEPGLFDPAENFIEASKLHRHLLEAEVPGIRELTRSPALLDATGRATNPYPQRTPILLPDPASFSQEASLSDVLQERRSPRGFSSSPALSLDKIGWLCWATDGNTGEIAPNRYGRTAPSGGALYPRDLYVTTIAGDIEAGLYHYNPYLHHLEFVNSTTPHDVAGTTAQPEALAQASAVLLLMASFWRNRMKYNQRGVRFALTESGHVAQNALLAAVALGLSALPIGGYFDEELNTMLGADGLHEEVLYAIFLGSPLS